MRAIGVCPGHVWAGFVTARHWSYGMHEVGAEYNSWGVFVWTAMY